MPGGSNSNRDIPAYLLMSIRQSVRNPFSYSIPKGRRHRRRSLVIVIEQSLRVRTTSTGSIPAFVFERPFRLLSISLFGPDTMGTLLWHGRIWELLLWVCKNVLLYHNPENPFQNIKLFRII